MPLTWTRATLPTAPQMLLGITDDTSMEWLSARMDEVILPTSVCRPTPACLGSSRTARMNTTSPASPGATPVRPRVATSCRSSTARSPSAQCLTSRTVEMGQVSTASAQRRRCRCWHMCIGWLADNIELASVILNYRADELGAPQSSRQNNPAQSECSLHLMHRPEVAAAVCCLWL